MKGLLSQHPTNRYHTIVIDCAPIGFVDSMGMATLEQVLLCYNYIVAKAWSGTQHQLRNHNNYFLSNTPMKGSIIVIIIIMLS